MIVIRSIKEMSLISRRLRRTAKRIGFVPTMGALHEGHLSLIRKARQDCDAVVVSVFVNPIQFGQKEDLKRYPRSLGADARLCRKEGVDVMFFPDVLRMYPVGYRTYVYVEGLSEVLCGKFRPGHFRGVTTVVTKLFNMVQPDAAYFGQKDAQQALIIKRMAVDLNMPVEVKLMPTLRQEDGLALSSRNVFLSGQEKEDALAVSQSLALAGDLLASGIRDAKAISALMKRLIRRKKSARIEYISITDTRNLEPVKKIAGHCLIALAVRIGKTRVIDNMIT